MLSFVANSIAMPTRHTSCTRHSLSSRHQRSTIAGMTAQSTLRALVRITQHTRVCGRSTSTSCSGAGPPAAPPPCKPHPRPPCRARPECSVRAMRVVCCPPSAGHRPPCPKREPRPSVTCAADSQGKVNSPPRLEGVTARLNCGSDSYGQCGVGQDRVARRLALANAVRREDYEREAALPPERVHAVPTAHYRLGRERECARATDSRNYSIPCECPESPQRYGLERTPPPPRCVEVAPDDACRIDTGAHLDPCAHRPRVLVQIDRSATSATTTKTDACPPARTLKSRIMQSLKTRPTKGSTPLTPKSKDGPQFGRRNLHISALSLCIGDPCSATDSNAQANGLESMLQERAKLQEAGRGRTVCGTATTKRSLPELGVGGQLELPVPSGARRVRVHVAMDDDYGVPLVAGAKGVTPGKQWPAKQSEDIITMAGTKDSWLSIKNLQKKISGYKDETVSKRKGRDPKTEPSPSNPSPCDSPQTKPAPAKIVPPKPGPPKPCPANPCAPKKPKTEEKDKPKPLCRFLPLGLTASPIP